MIVIFAGGRSPASGHRQRVPRIVAIRRRCCGQRRVTVDGFTVLRAAPVLDEEQVRDSGQLRDQTQRGDRESSPKQSRAL